MSGPGPDRPGRPPTAGRQDDRRSDGPPPGQSGPGQSGPGQSGPVWPGGSGPEAGPSPGSGADPWAPPGGWSAPSAASPPSSPPSPAGAGELVRPDGTGIDAAERTLRKLELRVTRRLDGLLLGDHLGLLPGAGSEPAESREYRVGDDVRRMDWAVTARTTVPHVRDLVADRELETWVLVDMSASMEFGTATCEKRDLAIAAVAAVGFLSARTGNRIGALVLSEGRVRAVPARSGRQALRGLLRAVASTPRTAHDRPAAAPDAGGTTDLGEAIGMMQRPPRRRGLAVVVSDFLSSGGDWEQALRLLRGRHQVLAVEVLDPRELELPSVGVLDLVDPETGARMEVSTRSKKLRARYAAAAAAHRAEVAATLRRVGVGHLVLRTDRDWLVDVVKYVSANRHRQLAAAAPLHPGTR